MSSSLLSRSKVRAPAVVGTLAGALALGAIALAAREHARRYADVRAYVASQVPAARPLFDATSTFTRGEGGALASAPAGDAQRAGPTLTARAPATADGAFDVSFPGRAATQATVRFVGAAPHAAEIQNGAAVYRNAYPGVDVVALHEPSRLELAYVVDSLRQRPELALDVTPPPGGHLRREPTTEALLVVDSTGQARLRLERPLAIDARGTRRPGTYELRGDRVVLALRWDGLEAPVVVDPAITIPAWSILSDGRTPGAKVVDASLLSREGHIAMDTARGRAVLVRPTRRRQMEDTVFLFGDASRGGHEGAVQRIAPTPRSGGASAASPATIADAARGYAIGSETWEWTGSGWSLVDTASLPGLVDPAMAFDGRRQRVVLYGGASPGVECRLDTAFSTMSASTPFFCENPDRQDVTYEYDGATWTAKHVASSPPPRVRASMVWDEAHGRVLLFGGRELDTSDVMRRLDPYAPLFPESFTRGLLDDTWAYDGESWQRIATGNPPPAREGAQLVFDRARGVTVLVGGHTDAEPAGGADELSIWELDGTDWIERVRPGDPRLPASLRTRRGAGAFYDPIGGHVTIAGGWAAETDACTLSDADIAARKAATASDPAGRATLVATGCLGGYVQDAWAWNGAELVRRASVAYGGMVGASAVFRQVDGAATFGAGSGATASAPSAAPGTPLLPWRYDPRPEHFAPRTALERAFLPASPAPFPDGGPLADVDAGAASVSTGAFVSPPFVTTAHPDVVFDPATATATVFSPDDGSVYAWDGARWTDQTPRASPFAAGPNDFVGAAWDAVAKRAVVFEPQTASTWLLTDAAGWQRVAASNAPPAWPLGASVRAKSDLDVARVPGDSYPAQAAVASAAALGAAFREMPHLVFDRRRGVAVMLYGGALWELDGTAWSSRPLPPALSACEVATSVAFDGARGRTVAFGCHVPATTWEWDGAAWAGPFASPYQAAVWRDRGDLVPTSMDHLFNWKGTLQSAWAHPDAAFESSSLGGVAMIDADGTARAWNGAAWVAGPTMPDGYTCFVSSKTGLTTREDQGLRFMTDAYPWPIDDTTLLGKELLPLCFFPPVIEDTANRRVVAFRDGPRGMMSLPFGAGAWQPLALGKDDAPAPWGGTVLTTASAYPFELMSAEHGYFMTVTDPASRQYPPGEAPPKLPGESWRIAEKRVPNLFWPFRLMADPLDGRVRLLTDRGVLWELAGQTLSAPGDSCQSDQDCGAGTCGAEKVCCDTRCDGLCTTCKASAGGAAGTCHAAPAGAPEPRARCGDGECVGACSGPAGPSPNTCTFDATRACGPGTSCASGQLTPRGHCAAGAPACLAPASGSAQACAGGLGCADATQCKTACTSRVDCLSRYQTCTSTDAGASTCAADVPSQLATARGITPVDWTPPPRRTPQDLAAMLADAGNEMDDAGRIVFPDLGYGGVVLAFDPNLHNPATGVRACFEGIRTCILADPLHGVDSCVAAAPRCRTDHPWLDDPAGDDCCPEACLSTYFTQRATHGMSHSLDSIATSGCYPGLPAPDGGTP